MEFKNVNWSALLTSSLTFGVYFTGGDIKDIFFCAFCTVGIILEQIRRTVENKKD